MKLLKEKIVNFFKEELWEEVEKSSKGITKVFIKVLRIAYMVVRGFYQHECLTRATALTYTTLLSMIPVLALTLAIVSVYTQDQKDVIEENLNSFFKPLSKMSVETNQGDPGDNTNKNKKAKPTDAKSEKNPFVQSLMQFVKGLNVRQIGIWGAIFLFISVLSLLGSAEHSFNKIWGISRGRPILKKLSSYWTIVTFGPIFITVSLTLSASLSALTASKAKGLGESLIVLGKRIPVLEYFSTIANNFVQFFGFIITGLFPFCCSWAAFLLVYYFLPNTKVKFKSAAMGGLIGAFLFELAKPGYTWYVQYFASASNINKAYGALGVIPIFLLWVYIVWLIVLLGAEFSYAIQNVKSYQLENKFHNLSHKTREQLSIEMVLTLAKSFLNSEGSRSENDLQKQFNIPIFVIRDIFNILEEAGLIGISRETEFRFYLNQSAQKIYILDILKAIRGKSKLEEFTKNLNSITALNHNIAQIHHMETDLLGKLSLKDLILPPSAEEEQAS